MSASSRKKQKQREEQEEEDDVAAPRGDYSEYRAGSIIRMRVMNFMSYEDATFHPGPRLNVILGPNGTGKSALVCAMGLGLGLEVKQLGRGDAIKDFVKFGKSEAVVEIDLYDPRKAGKVLRLRREILTNNSSRWRKQGKKCSQAEVQKELARLHVQVSSLCQFLPQDRVGDFSQLNPVALLKETEGAVGGDAMVARQERLVELGAQAKEDAGSLQNREKALADLKQENEERQALVEQMRRRQELLDQIELMRSKLPWLEFEVSRNHALSIREEVEEAERAFLALEEAIAPRLEHQAALKAKVSELTDRLVMLKRKQAKEDAKRVSHSKKLMHLAQETEVQSEAYEDVAKSEKASRRKVENFRRDVSHIEHTIENIPDESGARAERKVAQTQVAKFMQMRTELDNKLAAKKRRRNEVERKMRETQSRVNSMQDDRSKRELALQRTSDNHKRVYDWLQNQKQKGIFRQDVEMLCFMLSPRNGQAAACLENSVAKKLLMGVIVRNAEDALLVRTTWGDRNKIGGFGVIEVLESEEEMERLLERAQREAKLPDRVLELGGTDMAFNMVNGPLLGKVALYKNASTTRVLVGGPTMEKNRERLCEMGYGQLFAGNNVLRTRQSQYDRSRFVTQVDKMRPSKLLVVGTDAAVRNKVLQQLKEQQDEFHAISEEVQAMEQEQAKVQRALQEMQQKVKSLEDVTRLKQSLLKKLAAKKALLANELAQDFEKEARELKASVKRCLLERAALMQEMPEVLAPWVAVTLSLDGVSIQKQMAQDELHELQEAARGVQEQLKNARQVVMEKKRQLKVAKAEARAFKRMAIEASGELTDEMKAAFQAITDDLSELKASLRATVAQADLIIMEEGVLEEYEQRQREIEELERSVLEQRVRCQTQGDELAKLKHLWLEGDEHVRGIRGLVQEISVSFASFMKHIGCEGEVVLRESEEDNFDEYAVELRVSFRPEAPLKVLSGEMQSGGERSVATMMYLLALQRVTPAPFRLVDEINQAMDETNERKIFDLIVDVAAGEAGLPQYFLVTPKLLAGLRFTSDMTVFVVFNGYYNLTQSQWDQCNQQLLE